MINSNAWAEARLAIANILSTGIDTACQPKHYREDLVGDGLRKAIREGVFKRGDIFIQTKFTPIGGQDPRNMPYDPRKSIVEQVQQSIETSLRNFTISRGSDDGTEDTYLDSVVLHSPMPTIDQTMEVWRTLESYVPGKILNLGISNVDISTLTDLYGRATVKPSVVQNRFYPATRFDVGVRKFCRDHNIIYQSFWTLSANPQLLLSKPVQDISSRLGIGRQAALYCLVLGLNNLVVLNGTTNKEHMKADWHALSLAIDFASSDPLQWEGEVASFKALIRQPWIHMPGKSLSLKALKRSVTPKSEVGFIRIEHSGQFSRLIVLHDHFHVVTSIMHILIPSW